MKLHHFILAITLCLLSTAHAFTPLSPGYTVENYAQYGSNTSSRRMVFDDSGNLYINHKDDGKIMKINSSQEVTTLATGLTDIYDITWGGGTAFGDNLYGTKIEGGFNDVVWKIDPSGNVYTFADMSPSAHGPGGMAIDTTGNYGNNMFVGTSSQDKLYRIQTNGSVSVFSSWPGWTNGGGVWDIEFDETGKYNNLMYVATGFLQDNAQISGLFAVNPDGVASRFSNTFASAGIIRFDTAGTYFDGDMFVIGRDSFDGSNSLWRVFEDGTCEEFMTGVGSFAFGGDGAMYVSTMNWNTHTVEIARVIPEPATLLFLAIGGLYLRKKRA